MLESFIEFDKRLFMLLNGSDSIVLDHFALTETSRFAWIAFVLTVLYLIVKSNNFKRSLFIFFVLFIVYLSTEVLVSGFFQPYFSRLRPGMDLTFVHNVDLVDNLTGGIHGFLSNQASKLMAFTVFLSLQFRSLRFFIFALLWTILHSWSIVYLGYYFPFDILCGWMWGAFIGFVSYFLLFLKFGSLFFDFHWHQSEQCTPSGYFNIDIQFATMMFLLNLVFIIIASFINI